METSFIYEKAPFPAAHASTIAASNGNLVAAWFGGTREKHRDVGIWVSRRERGDWTEPREVADGQGFGWRRYPCWNPVLFQPSRGPLMLFYRVGRNPRTWWSMLRTSADSGRSWSEPRRLPEGFLGPIKNKPVELSDGTLLCPSSTEDAGWRVHVERTADGGQTWASSGPLNERRDFAAIQPTILPYPDGRFQLLCRTRQGVVGECWSEDGGRSWSALRVTDLPNPDSGIDAVMLADGRALLIYNRTKTGRSPLNLAMSRDGRRWHDVAVLEDSRGEFSYPAIIQDDEGRIHATYTWNRRRIKYVGLTPEELQIRD